MKNIKLLLVAIVPLVFQAFVASKNLSNNDVGDKGDSFHL